MVYFFRRTPHRITITPANRLDEDYYSPLYHAKIEFDFSECAQSDGHGPSHGDLDRGYVERLLESEAYSKDSPPSEIVAAFHKALKEARQECERSSDTSASPAAEPTRS